MPGQTERDERLRGLATGSEVQAFLAVPGAAVYICRRDGHILWASDSMQALLGYRPADLVGRNAWDVFPAREDLELGAKASAFLNEGDLVVWLPLLDAAGRKAWYRLDGLNREGGCVLALQREKDPANQRFHSFHRSMPKPAGAGQEMRFALPRKPPGSPPTASDDGAARVAALAASDQVQHHLRDPRTGVYIVRSNGDIVWASPSMRQATGRGPEDLVGRNGWDVFVLPEELPAVARFRALLSQGDGTIWMRIRTGDGRTPWFRVDTWLRDGHILCAFRQEPDASLHHVHFATLPRKA